MLTYADQCRSLIVAFLICLQVLKLLYVCPHTTVHVSSYYCRCVLILLYMSPHLLTGPQTAIYVSSYYYICVFILLYMCPHATIYVSSYSCSRRANSSKRALAQERERMRQRMTSVGCAAFLKKKTPQRSLNRAFIQS